MKNIDKAAKRKAERAAKAAAFAAECKEQEKEKACLAYIVEIGAKMLAKAEKLTGTTFPKIENGIMPHEERLLRETLDKYDYARVERANYLAIFNKSIYKCFTIEKQRNSSEEEFCFSTVHEKECLDYIIKLGEDVLTKAKKLAGKKLQKKIGEGASILQEGILFKALDKNKRDYERVERADIAARDRVGCLKG